MERSETIGAPKCRRQVGDVLRSFLTDIAGIPAERISSKSTIDADLRMESVAFLELQVALEDELGIELDPVVIVELNELEAIEKYIVSLVSLIR